MTRRSLIALMGAASAASAQINALDNPGFEDGVLDPWFQKTDFGGPEDWNVTTVNPHAGQFCATDVGNKLIVQAVDPLATEDVLEVSCWVRSPEIAANAMYFEYADGSSEQWIFGHTTDQWAFFDGTTQLDAGKDLVLVGLWGYSGGGPDEDRTFLDDFRLIVATDCPADLDGDGDADSDDFFLYLDLFAAGDDRADIDGDGDTDADDFFAYLDLFALGC